MALNKFMHPRNIYRNPTDFGRLAKTYPEFLSVTEVDVTGKVNLNFKDPKSLRILTKYLLKSDFNLEVEIPEDRLVPTLPLRLNYVLWIEDLMASMNRLEDVRGIDIGTGACAIYPLLAAVKNKWHMVATESDEESLKKAEKNIKQNNLQDLIELKFNAAKSTVDHIFNHEDQCFDFCMCNPPFYSSMQELYESRSPARPPPKNAFTGSPQELITEGGELEFIRKLISESKVHKSKILIYTSMVGHKYNLKVLLQDLKADGLNHTHTEFCQGRVTRWGLAWTFEDYDIYELVPPRDKSRKKSVPIAYTLPSFPNMKYDVESITRKITSIFNDLKITYKVITKRVGNIMFDVEAQQNTWSNQRRKRRQMRRQDEDINKKPKLVNEFPNGLENKIDNGTQKQIQESVGISTELLSQSTRDDPERDPIELRESGSNIKLVLHAQAKIYKRDTNIILEMEYLDGVGGKEGLHQVVQYIKNNWKSL